MNKCSLGNIGEQIIAYADEKVFLTNEKTMKNTGRNGVWRNNNNGINNKSNKNPEI